MITAYGEDIAFAMCGGCPVPKVARDAFCHMYKGNDAMEYGNLCLLREIERRQNGILNLSPFQPCDSEEAKASLERRRERIIGKEWQEYYG
jgi:hypothetical protein